MAPKNAGESKKEKRKIMKATTELRKKIIQNHENGFCVSHLVLRQVIHLCTASAQGSNKGCHVAKDSYLMFLWEKITLPNNNITSLSSQHSTYNIISLYRYGKIKLSFHLYFICLVQAHLSS